MGTPRPNPSRPVHAGDHGHPVIPTWMSGVRGFLGEEAFTRDHGAGSRTKRHASGRAAILRLGVCATLVATLVASGGSARRAEAASTWTVCPAGPPTCQFSHIQDAIAAASNGDTITVAAGTYDEHVTIGKSLTVQGANVGIPGASVARGAESTVDGQDTGASFAINASNVTIDGFTIENGSGSPYNAGVSTSFGTSGARVIDNIITHNSAGLYLYGSNNLVSENLIENSGVNPSLPVDGSGIYTDVSANATISNNTFTNNSNGPITFGATGPSQNTNVTVTGNTINDVNLGTFVGVDGATISNNTFTSSAGYSAIGLAGADNNITVTGNTLTGGTRAVRIATYFNATPNTNIAIHDNQFGGQTIAGVFVDMGGYTGGNVDATENWWGDPSGPYNASSNPGGTGEPVTDQVTFKPWCLTPFCAIPPSTVGCAVSVIGAITAADGDRALVGGSARVAPPGTPLGTLVYTDRGPSRQVTLVSNTVLALVCTTGGGVTQADLYGLGTLNGSGSDAYRIELRAGAGLGNGTYQLLLSSGYDSGTQAVRSGPGVQITL